MKNVLLWGMGHDYETLLNQIQFEIYKGNINVSGIVCKKEDKYCKYKDGFKVITQDEINEFEYDYIIITSSQFYTEIKKETCEKGIESNKIIEGKVMQIPFFDFEKYSKLRENPVTILGDDCWGGYVYNRLNLPFTSPLINILWNLDEFSKFISEPEFYLNAELKFKREGNLRDGIYPIGTLGDGEKSVELYFVHSVSFDEALTQWNRRKKRMNFDNIFVKMGFQSGTQSSNKYSLFKAFEAIPYKKVLFYNGEEKIKGSFKTDRFVSEELKKEFIEEYYYNNYIRHNYLYDLDIFNLLLYADNYSRYDRHFMVNSAP